MRTYVWLILFVLSTASSKMSRSVNVAFETEFVLEPKDVQQNLSFLKQARRLIDKIYNALEPQRHIYRAEIKENPKLTDLLSNLGAKITELSLKQLKDISLVFKNQFDKITNTHITADTVNNIVTHPAVRRYIKHKVHEWMDYDLEPVKNIARRAMHNFAEYDINTLKKQATDLINSYQPVVNQITRRINNYFTPNDIFKIDKSLSDLQNNIVNNKNITSVVNNILKYIIFDKFEKLNDSFKIQLKEDIKKLRDYFNVDLSFGAQRRVGMPEENNEAGDGVLAIDVKNKDDSKSEESSDDRSNDDRKIVVENINLKMQTDRNKGV